MPGIAVVTDSNSGITQAEAKANGVYVVPMPFFIDGKAHFEGIDLEQGQFYELLGQGADVSTSQPSPGEVMELWHNLLKEYDELVYIPMSSGLSTSCHMAEGLAKDFDNRVFVVDNHRISVTQKQSVYDAKTLAGTGWRAEQIKEILEQEGKESSIYLMVDTLKYLKKGGRITPAAAMIGTVLKIKPVLTIQGERLDAFAKARGVRQAKKVMLEAMKKDMETRFAEDLRKGRMCLQIAYSYGQDETVAQWRDEVQAAFPGMKLDGDPLSLSVACHTGPGVLAVACSRRVEAD